MVFLEELVFFLEGHVAYGLVLLHELLHLFLHVVGTFFGQRLQLCDDVALLGQVLALGGPGAGVGAVACLEEFVAGGEELVPQLVAQLLGHHADGFPFLLQGNELVAGGFPLGAVLQGLGLFHECALLLGVFGKARLHVLEEFCLAAEEVVASGAETLEDFHVHLLRSEADGLPFSLYLDDFAGVLLPVGGAFVFFLGNGFHLLAEGRFLLQVLLFPGAQVVEVLLVLLVDDGGSGLEACPHLLAQVFGHGACLAEFLVELLQLVEGADDVFLVVELLGGLAETRLYFKVFLEVVFAGFAIELEQVVELLYIELVAAPKLVGFLGGHGLDVFPFLL